MHDCSAIITEVIDVYVCCACNIRDDNYSYHSGKCEAWVQVVEYRWRQSNFIIIINLSVGSISIANFNYLSLTCANKVLQKISFTHLMKILDTNDTKQENEFIKNKIPQFVLHVLLFGYSKFAKHYFLNCFAQKYQTAVRHIDECLQWKEKKTKKLIIKFP